MKIAVDKTYEDMLAAIQPLYKKIDPLMVSFLHYKFINEFKKFISTNPPPSINELDEYLVQSVDKRKIISKRLDCEYIDGGVLLSIIIYDHEGKPYEAKLPYSNNAFKKSFLYEIEQLKKMTKAEIEHIKIEVEEIINNEKV